MDRRSNERISMGLNAQLFIGASDLSWVETVDLGLRGSQVTPAPANARRGLACTLVIMIASESLEVISAHGHISHADNGTCGIRFDNLDERDFEIFQALLRERGLQTGKDITPEIRAGHVPERADWSLGPEDEPGVSGT